jgi:hypothetical protein
LTTGLGANDLDAMVWDEGVGPNTELDAPNATLGAVDAAGGAMDDPIPAALNPAEDIVDFPEAATAAPNENPADALASVDELRGLAAAFVVGGVADAAFGTGAALVAETALGAEVALDADAT